MQLCIGIVIGVLIPILLVVGFLAYYGHSVRRGLEALAKAITDFDVQPLIAPLQQAAQRTQAEIHQVFEKQEQLLDAMLRDMGVSDALPPQAQAEVSRLEQMFNLPDDRA